MLPWSYKLLILAQHRERHREQVLTKGCVAQQLLVPALPLQNSPIKGCLDAPAFTSALQPAQCKASSLERSGGTVNYTKTEIAPKPCHSWCINSLLLDGFSGSYTKMPNSRWTKPQDRKFTLFPVFRDDKTFLTVIVQCFSEGMKNPPLPSTSAWSSHLMPKITALLPGNLPY